ncbi:GyrI-like domain-containing protein [Cardiobacteriaceae bacterium TAE3-ERU3]|nr:GyrI-like domain-containing protein [Cardiobacteriaceae bacterium TAE3-ERU3]
MFNIVEQPAINVSGIAVRTNNRSEMQSEGGKLGGLWQQFYQHFAAQLPAASGVYGVYSDYASDEHGDFTVIAALAGVALNDDDAVDLTLPAGKYLKFSQQGDMPQAVVVCWQAVWAYFSAEDCPHTRSFTTDYEHYISANQVDIYIAVA